MLDTLGQIFGNEPDISLRQVELNSRTAPLYGYGLKYGLSYGGNVHTGFIHTDESFADTNVLAPIPPHTFNSIYTTEFIYGTSSNTLPIDVVHWDNDGEVQPDGIWSTKCPTIANRAGCMFMPHWIDYVLPPQV